MLEEQWYTKIWYPTKVKLVTFEAVFQDVTQRSPFEKALRDIPKDGCEGDWGQTCSRSGSLLTVDIQLVINFFDTKFSCKKYRKLDRLD